jgi:hypothetical protein
MEGLKLKRGREREREREREVFVKKLIWTHNPISRNKTSPFSPASFLPLATSRDQCHLSESLSQDYHACNFHKSSLDHLHTSWGQWIQRPVPPKRPMWLFCTGLKATLCSLWFPEAKCGCLFCQGSLRVCIVMEAHQNLSQCWKETTEPLGNEGNKYLLSAVYVIFWQ